MNYYTATVQIDYESEEALTPDEKDKLMDHLAFLLNTMKAPYPGRPFRLNLEHPDIDAACVDVNVESL